MFCKNCGNEVDGSHKFCIKCGQPTSLTVSVPTRQSSTVNANLDQQWWLRLAKVFYIFFYLPLPLVLYVVWNVNSSYYDYYSRFYTDTTGTAFWYTLLALVIYVAIVRLIKLTFLYIVFGQKAEWKKEFRKLF